MSSQHPSEIASSTAHLNSPPEANLPSATEASIAHPTSSETTSAMELTDLPAASRPGEGLPYPNTTSVAAVEATPVVDAETSALDPLNTTQLPTIERKETEAIGPATEGSTAQPVPGSTALQITLLLSSGSRHPFKIDEKYLKKRGVDVEDLSPLNISVYTMKELIWKDWRAEWEPRPSSPAYIRLIFFGAMLDDKNALKDCRFNTAAPNVVHMSVKPQEIAEEEDVKQTSKKGARRGSESDRQGSRCCVIL